MRHVRALSVSDDSIRLPAAPQPSQRFGTFLGVFTPSLLTILGVMMYLRFGWVVGNAGLLQALLILGIASAICFTTVLSAAALATNMRVGIGGEYYMISRSLGLELGGAIGIPLFLCRTLSITLYSFGLAESVTFLWPHAWGPAPLSLIAAAIILVVTAVSGRSAALALRLQLPIMAAVGASILALAAGVLEGGLRAPEWAAHYGRSAPGGFWFVFAVFFPAVTGFAVGIGMSGDLEDPRRSIPRGTIAATAVGVAIYLAILALLGSTAKLSGAELAELDPEAPPLWTRIALGGFWLVYPGMWGAIASSAFGSALGAPRVLQALALDGLAPRFLARTSPTGQPTLATWISGAIALAAVLLGDLNAVGRWVTIFFLTLYATMNLVAALESLVGDPSYRPTIRVPWPVSLLGALGTIAVMFLISAPAAAAAIAGELLLYATLSRRAFETRWGDARAGLWTALARFALLRLRRRQPWARNWRPQILAFTANPASRLGLVRMASWLSQDRGIVTVCELVPGDLERSAHDTGRRKRELDRLFEREGLAAFAEVNVVPELLPGLLAVVQANGFAGLQSNTALFGWPTQLEGLERLLIAVRAFAKVHVSTIVARLDDFAEAPRQRRYVDVWWRGLEHNGDLLLLLAHLLTSNVEWRLGRIRLRAVVDAQNDAEPMAARLRELVGEARIRARAEVLVREPGQPVSDLMHRASADADIALLGLGLPTRGEEAAYAARLERFAAGFRTAVFVRNAGPFAGDLL